MGRPPHLARGFLAARIHLLPGTGGDEMAQKSTRNAGVGQRAANRKPVNKAPCEEFSFQMTKLEEGMGEQEPGTGGGVSVGDGEGQDRGGSSTKSRAGPVGSVSGRGRWRVAVRAV